MDHRTTLALALAPLLLTAWAATAPPTPDALAGVFEELGLPSEDAFHASPDPATAEACAARRARTAASIGDGLLVAAAGEDVEGRYHADACFYWLCGVNTPDVVLVVVAQDGAVVEERLYLPPHDPGFERWNGTRPSPGEAAAERFGIADTRPLDTWRADVEELVAGAASVHALGEAVTEQLDALGVSHRSASRLVRDLAVVRDADELRALGAAVDMTQAALVEAFTVVRPGAWEHEAEAAIEGGYRRRGAFGPSFPSIVGSGPNTCFLHYRDNARRFEAGDLVVMDVGARFRNYCADVTRTIPVSGDFTARQREVYDAVWAASIAGADTLRPGSTLRAAHVAAAAVLDERGFGEYFLHGVGHGLGLLVHDTPSMRTELEPGMVVTIEPGVYIAEEALGVRIENDWLITEDGARCLSDELPSEPEALLELLARIRPSGD